MRASARDLVKATGPTGIAPGQIPPITLPDLSTALRAWSLIGPARGRVARAPCAPASPLQEGESGEQPLHDQEGLLDTVTNTNRSKLARQLLAAMLWRQQLPDERVRNFVRPDDLFPETYQRVYGRLTSASQSAASLSTAAPSPSSSQPLAPWLLQAASEHSAPSHARVRLSPRTLCHSSTTCVMQ
jgi:hypothetical protein